jgi:hypothetical protein
VAVIGRGREERKEGGMWERELREGMGRRGKCDGETGTVLNFVSHYRHLRMMLKGM